MHFYFQYFILLFFDVAFFQYDCTIDLQLISFDIAIDFFGYLQNIYRETDGHADGQVNGQMAKQNFSHSTGLCPLLGPLPKKENMRLPSIWQMAHEKIDK